MDLRRAYLEMRRAGAADFPPACLDYVYRLVFRHAQPHPAAPRPSGKPPEADRPAARHMSAAALCLAFQKQARVDFSELAPAVMERWGLRSGLDLGRAVFLLARFRCLSLREGETLEEYAAAGRMPFA